MDHREPCRVGTRTSLCATCPFDAGADIPIIRTPVRALRANAIAEGLINTRRRECLDHPLITGPPHLDAVLQEFVEHDNTHRPHRSLRSSRPTALAATVRPIRRGRLGGLIHEYVLSQDV